MTKTKKWSLAVGILLIGTIVLFLAGLFPRTAEAHAEATYFSAEQYTESDQLLQADGTLSLSCGSALRREPCCYRKC